MKKTAIIRHPELSKMSDNSLISEFEYSKEQCERSALLITNKLITIIHRRKYNLPLWKLHEDYQIHTERLEAIANELEFRQIP